MDINKEHIIQLILEEINDMISEEDKTYLYEVVGEHEELFQLYMETHAELNSDEVKQGLARLAQIDQSKNFSVFLGRRIKSWWKCILLIVVVKTVVIVGLVMYLDRLYMDKQVKTVVNQVANR
jgi:hypothetical protein